MFAPGNNLGFGMSNFLDDSIVNFYFNVIVLELRLDPVSISSVLATFKLSLLAFSQQLKLLVIFLVQGRKLV